MLWLSYSLDSNVKLLAFNSVNMSKTLTLDSKFVVVNIHVHLAADLARLMHNSDH